MNGNIWRIAAAAVIGLLVILGGLAFLGGSGSGVGGSPQTAVPATAAPTATRSATPAVPPSSEGEAPQATLPPPLLLEPGRYRMASFGQVASVPATLSITLPPGYSFGSSDIVGNGAGAAFGVWQISNRFNHPCTDHTLFSPQPGPGVDELLAALASQPGIQAGPITDVTVDGYRGKSVELTVDTDIATCPVDTGKAALAGNWLTGFWLWASPDGDHRYVVRSDETYRIYAVDIDGTRFTFFAHLPAQITAADRASLQAIIDSINIAPGRSRW